MFQRMLLIPVVAVLGAFCAPAARADFVVDTFNLPSPAHTYNLFSPGTTTFTDSLPGGITRTTNVTFTSSILPNTMSGFLGSIPATPSSPGANAFSMSLGAEVKGFASLLYSYSNAINLTGAGSAVQFTFTFADQNTPFSVRIGDGTNTALASSVVNAQGAGVYSINVAQFVGVNLSNVKSIELVMNKNLTLGDPDATSVSAADIVLTDVRFTTPNTPPPPSVPAPAALFLMLAAAPALGLARLVRRKAAIETPAAA